MHNYPKLLIALALAFCGSHGLVYAQEAASQAPTSLSEKYQDWIVRCTTPKAAAGQKEVRVC